MTKDQRLARVERQCRLFKAGFALVTVALAVVLLIGAGQDQDKPKVLEEVRAKRFVVVDENGRNRIVLEVEEDNSSVLSLLDERERPRVHLEHRASGEYGVGLLDERSRLRAGIGAFREGRCGGGFGFGVFNKSGQAKFTVADCATGYTYLSIIDKNNVPRAGMGCDAEKGLAYVGITDAKGVKRANFSIEADRPGRLFVKGANGSYLEVGGSKDDFSIEVKDKDGNLVARLPMRRKL